MMKMLQNGLLIALIACAPIVTANAANADDDLLTREIRVSGEVDNPLLVSVDMLWKMQVFSGGEHQLVCRSGENKKRVSTFKGVLLKDILEKAKVRIAGHKESGRYVVLITSTNNYPVSYAYNELMFNDTGNHVYVTFEEDGAPITQDGGLMSVVTMDDTVTGVRHVKWPSRIEVIRLS
ncbi:MAG: molybdopterin-dependent oxidoreductase [Sterolibacterium sp.]|jgi:DMSO/TMAO reductase YedYZ molybdopterin-dependent catalytic subunit|nr:molybdopterin-dependent oxidoreductase [Sterolibacterium sp.]